MPKPKKSVLRRQEKGKAMTIIYHNYYYSSEKFSTSAIIANVDRNSTKLARSRAADLSQNSQLCLFLAKK